MSAEEGMRRKLLRSGTNQDGVKSCVLSSSVSTSAATFPMGEGLDRLILNCSTIAAALGGADCHVAQVLLAMTSKIVGTTETLAPAARRAHGSSAEHAMRDLIASHALLRGGRHIARQNGPKHYPGDPTGAAAPLVCLSPLSFFKQRKMVPPEVVG